MTYQLILSTAPSLREARHLARILLKKRLAACINITSTCESHYHWQGKQEKSKERILLIKTRAALARKVEMEILKSHSYSVPEIIAIPIQKGSRRYLSWIAQETKS